MKNNIWIALGMLISSMCVGYGQQAPTFQFTMYFTDAKGNQDSIVLGYAPDAHSYGVPDIQYGEEYITDTPFDTVLDIRVKEDYFYSNHLLKKQIYEMECTDLASEHWVASPLYIYTKYPPLKISWDNDLFYSYNYPCHDYTYIIADESPFADCTTCPSLLYLQFANYRNVTFQEYYNYAKIPVLLEDGTEGIGYMYHFGFKNLFWSTDVKDAADMSLQIYPSIVREAVQLVGDFGEEAGVRVLDVTGKEYPCVGTPTSEGFSVDVAHLPSGMYMVHTHTKGSHSIAVGRFVKL